MSQYFHAINSFEFVQCSCNNVHKFIATKITTSYSNRSSTKQHAILSEVLSHINVWAKAYNFLIGLKIGLKELFLIIFKFHTVENAITNHAALYCRFNFLQWLYRSQIFYKSNSILSSYQDIMFNYFYFIRI